MQAFAVIVLLFALNTASDAQVFDGGRFDIGNTVGSTISQAEGALGSVQDADEALGIGQAVGTAALGEAQQAVGPADLGTVTDLTLDGVQQANDELGFGQTFGDIEKEAEGVLGLPDSRNAISGGGKRQKGCRLERGNNVGSRSGDCFREPECNEVCFDGEEEECSVSNERVCQTMNDQVIFTTIPFSVFTLICSFFTISDLFHKHGNVLRDVQRHELLHGHGEGMHARVQNDAGRGL